MNGSKSDAGTVAGVAERRRKRRIRRGRVAHGDLAGARFAVAVQQVQRRRAERARDILLDELSRGEKTVSVPEVEEAAAVLLRYGRAAQEGAARLNLRLMAKVIAGQVHQQALYADEFLRHADIIAGLRREEVTLLGALQRIRPAGTAWHF